MFIELGLNPQLSFVGILHSYGARVSVTKNVAIRSNWKTNHSITAFRAVLLIVSRIVAIGRFNAGHDRLVVDKRNSVTIT